MALSQLVLAFLPQAEPTQQARCASGQHRWLRPDDSLRSARSGYRLVFCRYCAASQPRTAVAPAAAPRDVASWAPVF